MHQAVAIGDRVRLPQHLDRIVVVKRAAPLFEEGVGRQRIGRTLRRVQPVLHVLMRHDGGADAGIAELQREERPANTQVSAGLAQRLVATRSIGKKTGVGNELHRLVAQRADGGERFGGARTGAGIDDEHAFAADLHDDVSAVTDEHVDVAAHRQDVDLAVGRFRGHRLARRLRTA